MNSVHPKPNLKIPATDVINPILSTSGDYSDVYKCILTTGCESTLVAVKSVRFGWHKEYYNRNMREINLRIKLNHPNITRLLGTTEEFKDGSFPSLVFPWMPSGDLHCYIAYHGAGIEASLKLSLARDIASGVTYLHKSHVIHGNLESKNVLIGPENRAYLTGFSLSTDLNTSKLSRKPEPGGVRFAAPECLIHKVGGNSLPIINSDIYSLGCILFHVFSGCLPWHGSKSGDIINELRQRRMPSRPGGDGIDDSLWNFITRCCSFIPRDRPSATQILEFLDQYKPSKVNISPDDLTNILYDIPLFPTDGGSFADIRKCTLKRDGNTIQVALKSIRLRGNIPARKLWKGYLREIDIWARLMQENILPLLGVARGIYMVSGCDALVCPWMENGTLSVYLSRYPTMELRQKLKLLCDVATGLRYLHSQRVVHGDLTNNNILVDVNGRAVVADFGLSCRMEFTGSYSATEAVMWMAPELNQLPFKPSIHSDMYSFGSIMNYVISGKLPFAPESANTAFHQGKPPCTVRGNDVSQEHWEFIQRCWGPFNLEHGTSSRPSAEEACIFLRKELELETSD
ncbi:kinase-like domain-containing protein [Suillus bovinus]|uniref:kinase-like domain-containing protein n=1 Tax=Suillus bovinus TaxID=48563 RepID=UPI001B87E9F2|nr:kinase-like domain-containing protein [Suillus bovinus]KAG2131268.1 kinase-like domain-containing protein [Suillus bovinus]